MTDEHDDDRTSPDLFGAEEPTKPGVGTGEAYIAVAGRAYRVVASLETLGLACPPAGAQLRGRGLDLIANGWDELAMLAFDVARITRRLKREENAR